MSEPRDYSDLEKRLRHIAESDDAKATLIVRFNKPTGEPEWTPFKTPSLSLAQVLTEAAAAIAELTKRCEEAEAPKAAWNAAITELAQMPECTAEALDKMRCMYTFIFDAVPEFTFEEEISDVVARYQLRNIPMSFSLHFAKGMRAFPIWSDPTGLLSQRQLPSNPLPDDPANGDENAPTPGDRE